MEAGAIVKAIRAVHWTVSDHVRSRLGQVAAAELAEAVRETKGDVIYALDRDVDEVLIPALEHWLEPVGRFRVIGEGLGDEEAFMVPAGADPRSADGTIIIDPIDGTRPLMYGKRSAWILSGYAPGTSDDLTLEDIEVAVQTEIPTPRAALADQLWAIRGGGACGLTRHLETGRETLFEPTPSRAKSIRGGFAGIVRYFPPGRDVLARIDDLIVERATGVTARAHVFEDQYLSWAGVLYDMMTGKNRYAADLRPFLYAARERRGLGRGHDGHPYDLCTALVAREAGVIVTAVDKDTLDFPLDTSTPTAFAAYANDAIRAEIEPRLLAAMREEGLL